MGERRAADEDGRTKTDGKSEEWAILGLERYEDVFKLQAGIG